MKFTLSPASMTGSTISDTTSLDEGSRKDGLNKGDAFFSLSVCSSWLKHKLYVVCWNVRTFLDTQHHIECKMTVLQLMDRYELSIDIKLDTMLIFILWKPV